MPYLQKILVHNLIKNLCTWNAFQAQYSLRGPIVTIVLLDKELNQKGLFQIQPFQKIGEIFEK